MANEVKEKEKKEKKAGRHGSKKRPYRIEVILTDEEKSRLDELSVAANEKPAKYIRKLIMGGGTVKAALTAEERKSITDLRKIGTNIWEIRKNLINYGLDEKSIADIKAMYDEFAKIKDFYKEKLQK